MERTTASKLLHFASLLFVALALVPAGAHLLELKHKIALSGTEYLTVQQIYRGWSLAGIVVVAALLSTIALAIALRDRRPAMAWAMVALACIVGTQVVFWTFTFPVNQATENWTVLPANWAELRARWEYSHAASAVLNLGALVAVILATLKSERT